MASPRHNNNVDTSVKSLEFRSLPLVRVKVMLQYDSPLEKWGLASLAPLMAKVSEKQYEYRPVLSGDQPSETAESVWSADFALEIKANDNVIIVVSKGGVHVLWGRLSDFSNQYIRYAAMREYVEFCLDIIREVEPGVRFNIVNMQYENFASNQNDIDLKDLLGDTYKTLYDNVNAVKMQELNLRWRVETGLDRALRIIEAKVGEESQSNAMQGDGYLLRTITGKFGEIKNPIDVLDNCHDDLQQFFIETFSSEAMELWGLQK